MSVDTEYDLFVDAALAFGGLDQHARNSHGDSKCVWVSNY
jgi:hypothetical protein